MREEITGYPHKKMHLFGNSICSFVITNIKSMYDKFSDSCECKKFKYALCSFSDCSFTAFFGSWPLIIINSLFQYVLQIYINAIVVDLSVYPPGKQYDNL